MLTRPDYIFPEYPDIGPALIPWGPGHISYYLLGAEKHTDAALSLVAEPSDGQTVARLVVHSYDRESYAYVEIGIELTPGDVLELARALNDMDIGR